jgi:hypothetical protein
MLSFDFRSARLRSVFCPPHHKTWREALRPALSWLRAVPHTRDDNRCSFPAGAPLLGNIPVRLRAPFAMYTRSFMCVFLH